MDKQKDEIKQGEKKCSEMERQWKLLSVGVVREENKARMPLVALPHGTLCRGAQGWSECQC